MESIDKYEKISLLIKKSSITQAEIANKIRKNKDYLSRAISNKTISDEIINDILTTLNVDKNDFWNSFDSQKSDISNGILLTNYNVMLVPLVHKYARAGYLSGYGDDEYIDELPKIPMIIDSEHRGKYIAIELKGESMFDESYNSYLEGDIIFGREIQKQHWQNKLHINKWDFIILHKYEGILVKRIIAHDTINATITIHSLNHEYTDQIISLNDVLQLYNVVKIEREMKR